ncbi:acetyl-CoA synthetase-like protein [Xylariaceae sp. AK1471]|nr:acetyl-CoA synthetase-like protein [Xylariaceae sp. AK1471]
MGGSVEQILLQLYAEVLSIPEGQISLEASFIGLGGDSFKAIKLKRKCDQQGIRLSLRDIFAWKTIAGIAAGQGLANGRPKRLRTKAKKERIALGEHERFPLMPQDYCWDAILEEVGFQSWSPQALELVESVYPCSPMQQSIYVARETRGKHLYRIHALFEMDSSITIDLLESAWQSVVDRHESLRTVFVPATDSGFSRLLDAVVLRTWRCNLERIECKDHAAILALYQESCMNPQDFPRGPPHRLTSYTTEDGRRFCAFDQSHMISDGTSLVNMVTEICDRSHGSVFDLAPGYSRFVQYNHAEQHLGESLGYWKSYLGGAQPCNFPSLCVGSQFAEPGALEHYQLVEIPFLRRKELSEFCTKLETTVSTALQAAWAILLRTYTGNDEVCFGYTCAGRDLPLDGVDMICGPLVNLVVRRVSLADESIKSMIETIQRDFINSLPFQTVPFMRVQQLLETAENKIFNTIMTVQYAPSLVDESDDLPLSLKTNFNASDFGLSVQVMYSETAAKIQMTYSTSLLSQSMAERVIKTFLSIIDSLMDAVNIDGRVEQLAVISHSDRQQAIDWNQETLCTSDEYPADTTVHGLIEETAICTPHAPAVYYSGEIISYSDLDSMSTCLAGHLLKSLSDKQRFIPLLLEKSALYSVAMLAVLKCGRAFVPVDVSNPLQRIQQLLEQLGITPSFGHVICSDGKSEQLRSICGQTLVPSIKVLRTESTKVASENLSTILPVVQTRDPAYIIFTSGSTGNPKGVMVSHSAYAHAARTHAVGIGIGPGSRVLQFASYSFDTSMEDHLTSFVVGACICVPTETERETALVDFINRSGANWLHITPSMADTIPPRSVPSLTTMVLGGEPVTSRNVTEWAIPGRRLIQVYGPSECCVTSTIDPDVSIHRDATSIGRTFAGCATWITDPHDPNILYPVGAVGELLMEGRILAQGYLGQSTATESAFITGVLWAPEKRLYRTGDLVQYDEHGKLHFVGRADSRVKIRGQRVECGEIESQLVLQSSVLHAIVIVPKSGPGAEHLIGVVSLKPSEELSHLEHPSDNIQLADLEAAKTTETAKTLHNWLAGRLPSYMLPDLFVLVRHIPMNSSKKLDRKQIVRYMERMSKDSYRQLIIQMDGPTQDRTGTELERSLKRVWCRVLNVPESAVNWNTSWFSSGGDSISAMMLSSELRKDSISIAAADVLRLRNIERIATHIQDTVYNELDARFRNIDLTSTKTDVPWELSPIQQLSFQFFPDGDCFDQQTMVVDTALSLSDDTIFAALNALVTSHPMLLTRFMRKSSAGKQVWAQRVPSMPSDESAYTIRFHHEGSTAFKLRCIAETKSAIDIVQGPIMGIDVFRSTASTTISVSIHHLAVDMVSWRIIFQDLEDFIKNKRVIQPEAISFQSWCQVQHVYAQSIRSSRVLPEGAFEIDLRYWSMENTPNVFGDAIAASFIVERSSTLDLLDACDKLEYDHVDVVCAAISTSFSEIFQKRAPPAIFIEGHGRESPSNEIDLSRTVGWFTTLTPVTIRQLNDNEPKRMAALGQIKQFREATPSKGLDYFTSRFIQSEGIDTYRERHARAEIIVNFLGAFQQFERHSSVFKRCDDPELTSGLSTLRRQQRKASERYSLISIVAFVENGSLSVEIEWNRNMAFQDELALWSLKIKDDLLLLIKDMTHLSDLRRDGIPAPPSEYTCFGVDEQKALAKITSLGLLPYELESMYPCSPMQQGLMASLLRDTGMSSAYNQTFLLKITPAEGRVVGSEQLVQVWLRMVQKHAVLRTIFVESDAGDYVQVVLRHIDPVVLIKGGVGLDELRTTLFESENKSLKSPLGGFPLHRVVVCEASDKSMYIILTKSHLLTDGMSTQILMQDFVNGCDGVGETYWIPQHYYLDYIRYVNSQDIGRARTYWAAYLNGAVTCNFPRLSYMNDLEATVSYSSVSSQLHVREVDIRQLCRAHDLTVSNIFKLAWALVLRVYMNSESILFGFLASGRDLPIAGIQEAVGPVANMLPIRSELRRDMKVVELAKSLQANYIEHLSHQSLSLAEIRHAARHRNQTPSFNTILNIQKQETVGRGSKGKEAHIEFVKSIDTTEYGLALTVTDNNGEYGLHLEYDTDLISSHDADRIVAAFATAVKNVVASPECHIGDIDLAGDQDRKQIQRWDVNELQTRTECVHDLFQATARSVPDKEAIYAWDGRLTYGELETLTNNLARRLINLSVQPEEIVLLCFEKSIWGIVAMISVAKAGGTFVHIDPSSPISRKQQIINVTAPRLAIASTSNLSIMKSLVPQTLTVSHETLLENDNAVDPMASKVPEQRTNPSNALYVIFTSGSTGEPKGVIVEHWNFCSAMAANTMWLQILPSSRVLQFSSFVFDASMEEILTALVAGACVCVPSDEDRMSPEGLTSFMQGAGVNWAALTPSFLQTLDPAALVPPLKFITVHAEPMNASLTKLWSPRVHMRPSYGPTECTVTSTVGSPFTEFSDPSNIGWPVGCLGRVTDPHDPERLVPIGAVGELILEGPILGRGYLNRQAETASAFPHIRDWFNGKPKRVYRTGDLVRYADDGSLRILGRRDTQVKVRGQRVELGEIQRQLDLSPNIRHGLLLQPKSGLLQGRLVAVLSLARSPPATQSNASHSDTIRLVNYSAILSEADHSTTSELLNQIRSFVSARLPSYMIPHTWCVVEEMPTLPSYKLDRKRVNEWLEEIDETTLLRARQLMSSSRSSSSGTDSDAEKLVRAAWSHVLEIPGDFIDVDDHFIALGGDSISAMHVARFLSREGVPVKTQDVLKSNSIRELAAVFSSQEPQNLVSIKTQSKISGIGPRRLPSVEEIVSEYSSNHIDGSNILSILHSTPFQVRTSLALYKSPSRPYLYNLFAEIGGYGAFEESPDPHRLLKAWRATVARHDILRTAILLTKDSSSAYQVVLHESAAACGVVVTGTEKEALDASIEKTEQVKASLSQATITPPLWLTIFTTQTKQVYMHLLMGHMLIDHVSLTQVLYHWDMSYRGQSLPGDPGRLPQFADYVRDVESRDSQASIDFWTQYLRGAEPTILPSTCQIPEGGSTLAKVVSMINFQIDIDVNMQKFCRTARVTTSTLLQFAWAVLLAAYTGQESVCFGHLASDRDIDIKDVDEIVGPMLSVLAGHVVLQKRDISSPLSLEETIQKLQHDNTASMAHKVFDLTTIERQLGLQPPTSVLFNTLINYRKVKHSGPEPVMNLRPILKQDPHEQQIILSFNEVGDATSLDAALSFYDSIHSVQSVQQMAKTYTDILTLLISGEFQTTDQLLSRVLP